MEIEIVQGCICDAFNVDGNSVADFSKQELKELLKKQFELLSKSGNVPAAGNFPAPMDMCDG